MSGVNITTQVLAISAVPYLTRIYSPEDFGHLALFSGILIVFYVVGCLRFDQLIYTSKCEQEIKVNFSSGVLSALVIYFLLQLLCFIVVYIMEIDFIYLLVPFVTLLFSVSQILTAYLSIKNRYYAISTAVLFKTLFILVIQCLMGPVLGGDALVWGVVSGVLVYFVIVFIFAKDSFPYFFSKIIINNNIYKNAFLSTGQSVFNALSGQLPVMFIPNMYGMDVNGYYAMATKLTQLPMTLLTNAIRPLLLGNFNRNIHDSNKCRFELIVGTAVLFILAVLGIVLISNLAESFFVWFAGDDWAFSGRIASILSLWLMMAFTNIFAISYLTVSGYFKFLFKYEFILLLTRGSVVIISILNSLTFMQFLYAYSIVGLIFNLFIIIYSIYKVNVNVRYTDSQYS